MFEGRQPPTTFHVNMNTRIGNDRDRYYHEEYESQAPLQYILNDRAPAGCPGVVGAPGTECRGFHYGASNIDVDSSLRSTWTNLNYFDRTNTTLCGTAPVLTGHGGGDVKVKNALIPSLTTCGKGGTRKQYAERDVFAYNTMLDTPFAKCMPVQRAETTPYPVNTRLAMRRTICS